MHLIIEDNVFDDILEIANYIENDYKSPITASKFKNDFYKFCIEISIHPTIYPKNHSIQLKKYGSENLQKAIFRKKWNILFETTESYVVIRKIIYGGLVKNLD